MGEFGFKELIVWQKSMDFADACLIITDGIKGHYRLVEQMGACACSVCTNIAEGKGRFSRKEFVHFLHISRGSLYEAITLLNLFYRRGFITQPTLEDMEQKSMEIL